METTKGRKLFLIIASLCVALLLSSLESTIVATALVSIAAEFKNYDQSNWVVITYLLTYSSFLLVFARLSDVTGRKGAILFGLAFFTIASLACGVAQTMTQLIVFRAFQGIGGAGIYALTMVIVAEITPKKQAGLVIGLVNVVFVVASAVGPLMGGAITSRSTWRWCFYLNVPGGVLVFVLIAAILPNRRADMKHGFRKSFFQVDWLGVLLLLAAAILVIIPLQEGGSQLAWQSGAIIAFFVVGGLCWIAFASWQVWLSFGRCSHDLLPMLPIRIALHRVIGSCILTSLLTGLSFTSTVVYLPQRFQIVNSKSPIHAGIHTLPLLLISAFGSTASGLVLSKANLCQWFVLAGNAMQLAGLALLSTLPYSSEISASAYGAQAVLGLGLGTSLSSSFLLARIELRREDVAPVTGAITQLRVFGGVIGVAICRVVQASYLSTYSSDDSSASMLQSAASNIASVARLPKGEEEMIRRVYGEAFDFQWRILTFIAIANVVLACLTFRRRPKPLSSAEMGEDREEERPVEEREKAPLER